jgi:hypothetical protein
MSARPTVHPLTAGGWCPVCGEPEEWLVEHRPQDIIVRP